MAAIVRLALLRSYTFVISILILIFGVLTLFRSPTDIFPSIGIPVISVVWQHTSLPPEDSSGRIVSVFERSLTTTVNDIEPIESQSAPTAPTHTRCCRGSGGSRVSPTRGSRSSREVPP